MEHRPIPAITVKSLQGLAVYKLARMLLTSAIPLSLEKYVPFLSRYDHVDVKETDASLMPIGCGTVFQRKRLEGRSDSLVQWNTLDDIILAEAGQCHDHLLPAKEILIVRIYLGKMYLSYIDILVFVHVDFIYIYIYCYSWYVTKRIHGKSSSAEL